MSKYCIALLPSRFCTAYKFVHATAYSQVDDSIMCWLTTRLDEALVIDSESEAWCLLHELQVRYPFKDFTIVEVDKGGLNIEQLCGCN